MLRLDWERDDVSNAIYFNIYSLEDLTWGGLLYDEGYPPPSSWTHSGAEIRLVSHNGANYWESYYVYYDAPYHPVSSGLMNIDLKVYSSC